MFLLTDKHVKKIVLEISLSASSDTMIIQRIVSSDLTLVYEMEANQELSNGRERNEEKLKNQHQNFDCFFPFSWSIKTDGFCVMKISQNIWNYQRPWSLPDENAPSHIGDPF